MVVTMAAKKKKKPIAKQSSKKSGAGAKKPKSRAVAKAKPKTTKKVVAKKASVKKASAKKASAKQAAPAKKATPAKKAATKKAAPAKKAPAAKPSGLQRRDGAGHLNPKYAKDLRAQSGHSTAKSDATRPAFRVKDDAVAEEMGEEVVGKANSGEDEGEDDANRVEVEEVGGPFVVTTGGEEFADGTDESNPEDAEREPFPKT